MTKRPPAASSFSMSARVRLSMPRMRMAAPPTLWPEICSPLQHALSRPIVGRISPMPALSAQTLSNPASDRGVQRRTSLMHPHYSQLQLELERQVVARTGRRVRDLTIELYSERVILRGHTSTYYVKQLAQHGVRDVLPH